MKTRKKIKTSAPAPCSAYSRSLVRQIKQRAMSGKGAVSVSHIIPRAYCIAKPAPCCAIFVTPWFDAEPQVRKPDHASSHSIHQDVWGVKAGDWCSLAYVRRNGIGGMEVVPMPNDQAELRP